MKFFHTKNLASTFIKKFRKESPKPTSLTFVLADDGNVTVTCNWQERDVETAHMYGEMLYYLNTGGFKPIILQILSQLEEESPEFIHHLVGSWADSGSVEREDQPVVMPSKVLNLRQGQDKEEDE